MVKDDVAKAFYDSLTQYSSEKRRKAVHRFFFGCFVAAVTLLTVIVWSNHGTPFGIGFLCAALIAYWVAGRTNHPLRAEQQTASPKQGRSHARPSRSSQARK